jgi:hypothetical protein
MTPSKLHLNRETLQRLEARGRSRVVAGDDSCVQSCYLNTCGPDCDPPLPSLATTAK